MIAIYVLAIATNALALTLGMIALYETYHSPFYSSRRRRGDDR